MVVSEMGEQWSPMTAPPRQAPRPHAIFFSKLARQGVPAAAHSLATPRIMTMGPQVSTMSYAAASSRSVTRP